MKVPAVLFIASALLSCTGAWAAEDSFIADAKAGAQYKTIYASHDLPTGFRSGRLQVGSSAGGINGGLEQIFVHGRLRKATDVQKAVDAASIEPGGASVRLATQPNRRWVDATHTPTPAPLH